MQISMNQKIKVYYKNLDPRIIINLDQPAFYREFTSLHKYVQLPIESHEEVNRLYIEQFDAITHHWTDLADSITERGILYPVVVSTGIPRLRNPGDIPHYLRSADSKFWLVCENSGGGRILTAKMLGITVPAVINDRVDLYHGQEELKVDELIEITHGLKNIDITDRIGLNFPILPRSHLTQPVGESDYAEERSRVVTGLIADYILPELRNL